MKPINIEIVKSKVQEFMNCNLLIKENLGRNKHEYYEGTIEKILPHIFVVKTNKGIKSFPYSEVLIKNVVLKKIQ